MMKKYPKYKNSGIKWLGTIPEHWVVKRIKHLLKPFNGAIKTGPFGSQIKNSELTKKGIKVYKQRNVIDNNFETGVDFITYEKYMELKAFEIYANDLLITTRGTIGRCAIFPVNMPKGILHPCLIRLQLAEKLVLNKFILWFMNNTTLFSENIYFNSNTTTIDVIYSNILKEIYIPIPSIKEQKKINAYLDHKIVSIDILIIKAEKQIQLLKEYRTTLISQVVTGKIDIS